MTTTAGCFAWHELHTRDCAKALAFYQGVFGWQTMRDHAAGEPGRGPGEFYGLCRAGGTDFGAVTTSKAPPHVPAHWLPYVAVDDVDAKTAEAKSLGARVRREPVDMPKVGRSAVLVDPRGAVFALRTPHAQGAEPADAPEGSFCWDELLTDDPEAAAAFYARLFGYSVTVVDAGPSGIYRALWLGQRQVAGVMKHPENIHPHWLPYIAARDVDAMTERARELGASIYLAARDLPGLGRFSAIDDPTGAGVCLTNLTLTAAWKTARP